MSLPAEDRKRLVRGVRRSWLLGFRHAVSGQEAKIGMIGGYGAGYKAGQACIRYGEHAAQLYAEEAVADVVTMLGDAAE